MIGYATLGFDDLEAGQRFYDPLLSELGAGRLMELGPDDGSFTLYGADWATPALR